MMGNEQDGLVMLRGFVVWICCTTRSSERLMRYLEILTSCDHLCSNQRSNDCSSPKVPALASPLCSASCSALSAFSFAVRATSVHAGEELRECSVRRAVSS